MNRKQYEDRFNPVSNEKWDQLIKNNLVPDKTSSISLQKFHQLMSRTKKYHEETFTTDEQNFLAIMDIVAFVNNYPIDGGNYMENQV